MLFYNTLDFRQFIDEKGPPFVPVSNLDPFSASIAIGISRLEVGDHSEEGGGKDVDDVHDFRGSRR